MSKLAVGVRRAVAAAAVGTALAAGATACSSGAGPRIDAKSAARQISAQLATRYHLGSPPVSCPSGVPAHKGRTFVCTASLDGQTVRMDATVKDSAGRFTVSPADPILVPSALAGQLTREIVAGTGRPVTVTCPGGPVVVVPVHRTVTCSATFSGQPRRSVTVTVVDQRGDFSFQLAPPS